MRATKMFGVICFLAIATIVTIGVPATAKGEDVASDLVMKAGQRVWLFHSGTPDVMKTICKNEVIPVYGEVKVGDIYKTEEVGKIKVLSLEGRHYFEAKVVSGNVKVGDIAIKGAASCLILPPGGIHTRRK